MSEHKTETTPVDESGRAERDPIEQVDMSTELNALRDMLKQHGFRCLKSDSNGEIWAQNMGGMPGFKCQLMVDQGGRIRAEIYNPIGQIVTQVSPALPVDVDSAMKMYVIGW